MYELSAAIETCYRMREELLVLYVTVAGTWELDGYERGAYAPVAVQNPSKGVN